MRNKLTGIDRHLTIEGVRTAKLASSTSYRQAPQQGCDFNTAGRLGKIKVGLGSHIDQSKMGTREKKPHGKVKATELIPMILPTECPIDL